MYASISTNFTGQVGNSPRIIPIATDATFSQVTTAGFINPFMPGGFSFYPNDVCLVSYGTNSSGFFSVSISNTVITLDPLYNSVTGDTTIGDFAVFSDDEGGIEDTGISPSDATKTKVVMASAAVIANHIACFSDTAGTVNDDSTTAINGGNIQAGLSATAGYLASYPSASAKGSLRLTAVANTGDTVTTISNAAMGQASVVSIPDPGASTANFLVSALAGAGTQHITTGNLQIDQGVLTTGSSGHVGGLVTFPPTAAKGALQIVPTDNTGDTLTTITNDAFGQATTLHFPDPGTVNAQIVVAPAALVDNNIVKASGTTGKVADAGYRIIANTTASWGGGGATNNFAATGLTAGCKGTAVIRSSTNAVSIVKAEPDTDLLKITFSGDPGAGTTIDYIYTTTAAV